MKNKDQKLKIAIIGHKRIPSNEGGVEKGVEQHAVRMAALGHSVTVYNRGNNNINGKQYNKKPLKEYKGVKIVTVPIGNSSLSVVVYSFLATIHALFCHYDVISFRASGPCVMILLAKLFGIRSVASLHGIDSQRDKWGRFAKAYLAFGEKVAAKRADACLVLSKHMKRYIDETYDADSIIFANGIEKPVRQEAKLIKDKWGLEKDSYILSLGRIEPEKGLHYLIDAFGKVDTDKKLVIAGGDSNHAYFKKLTDMAKNDDRILFVNAVQGDYLNELYSNAYCFVLPSNLEGMANTLLEAMSFGNCCIVSDIAENKEVVSNHAVLFQTGNIDELQSKLQMMVNHPEIVDEKRNTAADFILSRYSWDIVVEQMIRIYRGERVNYKTIWREHNAL